MAPIHLMDNETGEYNRPFIGADLELVQGYRRLQGIAFRKGDGRFEGHSPEAAVAAALADPDCLMVSRNAGSGTRVLIDRLLEGARPPGYWSQPKSHNAVAAAIAQRRADWGVTIESVARQYGLGFIPLQDEHYDFVVPKARLERAPVQRFVRTYADELGAVPSAFLQVSLAAQSDEAAARSELVRVGRSVTSDAGWKPDVTLRVAGALAYTQYGWFQRRLLRRVVARNGGDTDTSRDHEYTDWDAVEAFADRFAGRLDVSAEETGTG